MGPSSGAPCNDSVIYEGACIMYTTARPSRLGRFWSPLTKTARLLSLLASRPNPNPNGRGPCHNESQDTGI
eukprot:15236279-Alexandrium_andersonii.AAC.1